MGPEKMACTCKAAAQEGECVGRTVGREREVLSSISSIWSGPFVRGRVLVFGPKPGLGELSQIVANRFWLGIAILFLLIYISPGQFKHHLIPIFNE